jgi:hypothetical protein
MDRNGQPSPLFPRGWSWLSSSVVLPMMILWRGRRTT